MSFLSKALRTLEVPVSERETLSVLQNPDLQPIKPQYRIWGFWSNFGYWGIISLSMVTWLSASSSLSLGLNVREIIGAYILGDLLTLAFTLANSYPGTDWHIGYTVCQRISFGIYGSGLGILVRVLLSIVNAGSNAWMGGLATSLLLSAWSPSYMNMSNTFSPGIAMTRRDFVGFIIFQIICALCYLIKPHKMNIPLVTSCFSCFFAMLGMVIFLVNKADGYGDLFTLETELKGSKRAWTWVYIITIWFSSVSPGSTNQADYSRFASSKTKLWAGTVLALLIPTTVVPLFGVIGASCTKAAYGEQMWVPTDIVLYWLNQHYDAATRCAATFIAFAFIYSQVCLNVVTCGFAGGMDLAGVLPKYINIRRGALITTALSFAVQPWNFYNTSSSFLTVMSSFGVITTPIISIIVCDYFIIRKGKYRISHAFKIKDSDYYYTWGVNWRAMVAFVCATAPGLPGMAWQINNHYFSNAQGIINFYYGDTFFAFLISFFIYWGLCLWKPVTITQEVDKKDYYNAMTGKELVKYGVEPCDEKSLNSSDEVEQISTHLEESKINRILHRFHK
ncbi:putative membrane protein [Wickerhamomyces ciferrii]|uniref:Membrane protein n=1 Tax=Wickerhamomyces ciferrii (strain ATCC 14091 / BCRC 22168 / CBS 111 / JCM 3599 / NBRC 0793 / NRRL Y-1031 F-60-10) TaxID=1206466 RepID=K0KJG5_WICCF|nr:uncharacterized protein BN7_1170 [Wickerhamomyces ciferrii]CCH41629.1 putative membrane protein [Wickerhamomyces ciferrii]